MAYLKQQYKVVLIVFIVLAIIFAVMAYGFNAQNPWHLSLSLLVVSSRDWQASSE